MIAAAEAPGPMEQFEILPLIKFPAEGNIDLSFTNSSLWMLIGVGAIIAFFAAATSRRSLVPGRLQSSVEVLHEFIADLVRDTIGPEGRRFLPYIFTLFIFILVGNLFGLLPSVPGTPERFHTFTTTSHLAVTGALALLTITIVIVYGFWKNGLGFLKLFWPSGLPVWMYAFIPLIEFISFLSRPISLAIRLFANMLAGHIILKLFAGFVIALLGAGGFISVIGVAPFLGAVAVMMLEFLIAALQAYVFAILACIYLNDAVHAGSH
ncbi:MAG: F0F1 ATP synthase subunit A [Alphaproteobacteria bacterium]|nr:F0F1 ATP synthase subunit A [Alphaproteobacteria bacterium]